MPARPPQTLNIHPPPPPSSTATSNAPFTPRSTTFPDGLESDDDDFFVPTPTQSPGAGPHYDDLPPTYDEAQQQAMRDARNGVSPVNPETIDVHRLQLNDNGLYQIPASADMRAHRATNAELEEDYGGRGVAWSGERSVPVQHVSGSESIVVGRVGSRNTRGAAPVDPRIALLSTALEFTRHEPDADTRYAPRLTRCVAIPHNSSSTDKKGKGKQRECGGRRDGHGRKRGRGARRVPGQWPDSSSETLSMAVDGEQEPMQFLRAYAKALHAHSIRPAEFLDFLDGLNALCAATGTTPADITDAESNEDSPASVVRNYINATNEAFFAPRDLKVSVKSLAALLDATKIPEERGQRAGAVASVLDTKSTPEGRAQALHPWIEALETNVPEPSIAALRLKEMVNRLRHPPQAQNQSTSEHGTEERRVAGEDPPHSVPRFEEDPPHSIPGAFPTCPQVGPQGPGWPPFGGWQGRRGRGWGGHREQSWGPFGAPGNGPFGPLGRGPFGTPGQGPFGHPGRGPFGRPGNGPFGAPGNGPWGSRGRHGHGCGPHPRGAGAQPPNSWEAWGQNIGKWGEELGKRAEVWGEQVGRDAQAWSEQVAARASGNVGGGASSGYGRRAQQQTGVPHSAGPEALRSQETGVHHVGNGESQVQTEPQIKEKSGMKAERNDDDDDDASSISSDRDSDTDSDSDTDDGEDFPNAEKIFLDRIRAINSAAESTRAKGKKPPAAIQTERAQAIERAEREKTAMEVNMEAKRMKRAVMRDFREKKRELGKEYRRERRSLRREGKGKKSSEWKEMRKAFGERKRGLRREKLDLKRDLRDARWEARRAVRGGMVGREGDELIDRLVWVVVEDLD